MELPGSHKPAGPLRGGKYSAFDGGTRVPFVVRWPGTVKPGVSDAPVSQIDLLASFAALTVQKLPETAAPDSFNLMPALLGKTKVGRPAHRGARDRAFDRRQLKVIQPHSGVKRLAGPGTETGNDPEPQLFDLANDLGEQNNVAAAHPEKVKEMLATLAKIQQEGKSRPR